MNKYLTIFGVVVACFLGVSLTVPNVLAYSDRMPIQGTLGEINEYHTYKLGYVDWGSSDHIHIDMDVISDGYGSVGAKLYVDGKYLTGSKQNLYGGTEQIEFYLGFTGSRPDSGDVQIKVYFFYSFPGDEVSGITYDGTIEW